MSSGHYSSELYLLDDYGHTLFPLDTTAFLVRRFAQELRDFAHNSLLNPSIDLHFLPQQRCYAAKQGFHLRRTVKLDPVAELFIYELVYRNRQSFRGDHRPNRKSFGYRFREGKPQSPAAAYGEFKTAVARAKWDYNYTLSVDVGAYFNSIYHHDLVSSVRGKWPDDDVNALGTFLREANVGRSVDCLPHGLHPCKVLGSEFLRFIDNSYRLRSDLTLRFMDDIHAFANDRDRLYADLLTLQELLGERGLSLNQAKTFEGLARQTDIAAEVDEIKWELLQLRRQLITTGYEDEDTDTDADTDEDDDNYGDEPEEENVPLGEKQAEYLLSLINSPDVEEADAELVLAVLRDHGRDVLPRMLNVLKRFPGLSKNVYNYARFAEDTDGLDRLLLEFLSNSPLATEYQLFWLTKLAQDFLSTSLLYGDILIRAFEHSNSTVISRSKVLEIPEQRFGLPDLREDRLRAGRSDWEAWAAATGMRETPASARNHVLGYFANGSPLNRLIADCIRKV